VSCETDVSVSCETDVSVSCETDVSKGNLEEPEPVATTKSNIVPDGECQSTNLITNEKDIQEPVDQQDDISEQTNNPNDIKETEKVEDIETVKEEICVTVNKGINKEITIGATAPNEEAYIDGSVTKDNACDSSIAEEPLYKEPDDALESVNSTIVNDVSDTKMEDQYVTAEEVRIQKHKVVVKDEIFPEDLVVTQSAPTISIQNKDLSTEPIILEETSLLSNHIPTIVPLITIPVRSTKPEKEEIDPDQNVEEDTIRRSKDVEQLLKDIRDPNLDCSLEDIEAMIEGKDLVPPKEELNRVSPEFATAATLIDQNPDKGFDPEDPAVKGIEDWECSNLNTSLESVESRSSKFKSVFKRRRSRSEERKSLLDNRSNEEDINQEEEEENKVSVGCINSWLLYIFIKIFD
jgi:hypothetical protein